MSREPPLRLADDQQARSLLRALADASPTPRTKSAELAREERLTQSLDAELARLVRGRTRRRVWSALAVTAAAAAFLALRLGAGGGSPQLTITQEPPQVARTAPASTEVATPSSSPSAATTSVAKPKPRAGPTGGAARAVDSEPKSSLAEENQMFRDAADASREGDTPRALELLEGLLSKYPQSPLAQTAAVRKFRLLAKAGRDTDARLAARSYLTTYPTGFAVDEAQALQSRAEGEPIVPAASAEAPPP